MKGNLRSVLLGITILMMFPTQVLADDRQTIHLDPDVESVEFIDQAIFAGMAGVAALVLEGLSLESTNLVDGIELSNIPISLKPLLIKYTSDLNALSNQFDSIESNLALSPSSVGPQKDGETYAQIEVLKSSLISAREAITSARLTTAKVRNRLGIEMSFAPGSEPEMAFTSIRTLIDKLESQTAYLEAATIDLEQGKIVETAKRIHSWTISADLPSQGYPGREFEFSGSVIPLGKYDLNGLAIHVRLGNAKIGEFDLTDNFQHTGLVPPDILEGSNLFVITSHDTYGTEEDLFKKSIQIKKADPTVVVRIREESMVPQQFLISGSASTVFGPLQQALVTLRLGNIERSIRTDPNGQFEILVPLNLFGTLIGPEPLHITVVSEEPWNGDSKKTISMPILNFPGLGLLLVIGLYSLGTVSLKIYQATKSGRDTRSKQDPIQRFAIAPKHYAQLPSDISLNQGVLTGSRLRIVTAYRTAASSVEERHGISFSPHFTLRESAVRLELGAEDPFIALTTLAELALYRSRTPGEHEVIKAEQLTVEIKGRR